MKVIHCLLPIAVLILLVVGLFIFELKFNTSSCGMSSELLEIVRSQNSTDTADDPSADDPNFNFTGRYKMIKSENFDKFLEELGVGYLQRTIANKANSEYEITRNGDVYTLKTISIRDSEISFKLNGEEFEEDRMDGLTVKSSVVRKGRKWIHTQRDADRVVTIVREFKDDQIVVSGVLNGAAFVRIYKKIEANADDDYEE